MRLWSAFLFCFSIPAIAQWNVKMQTATMALVKTFKGEIGVYVRDSRTGQTYSMNADTPWYLASGVKIFVALQTLKSIEDETLSRSELITISRDDYRDGAGQTNWIPPGDRVTVQFLLEQMLWESDNAATDILMTRLGLDKISELAKSIVPDTKGITTMLDVRRMIFSQINEAAKSLTNMHFIEIKKATTEKNKIKMLSKLSELPISQWETMSIDQAYGNFYAQGLNSSSLRTFAAMLEKLNARELISKEVSNGLIDLMSKCETGKKRIRGGLPNDAIWAHKTGTQHRRVCDFGIIDNRYIVAACIKDFKSIKDADGVLRNFGDIITRKILKNNQ